MNLRKWKVHTEFLWIKVDSGIGYIHRKKKVREFSVPSRDVTTKLSLGGNNDVITELFLPRRSLVSDIPAGDGKLVNLFLRCRLTGLYNNLMPESTLSGTMNLAMASSYTPMSKRTLLEEHIRKRKKLKISPCFIFHLDLTVFAVRTFRNKNTSRLKGHCHELLPQSLMIEFSFFAFSDMQLCTNLRFLPVSLIPWKINR